MQLFEAIRNLFSSNKAERIREHEEAVRHAFQLRCRHFKGLLAANKRALVSMANLEECLRGERFFNLSYLSGQCTTIVTNVYNMVRNLGKLTGNDNEALFERLKEVQQHVSETLSPRQSSAGAPLVLPLASACFSQIYEVGGKMASLGEAQKQLGQTISPGFVITASGYRRFIDSEGLQEEINRLLLMTDFADLEAVFSLSDLIQQRIVAAPLPEDFEEAVRAECEKLLDDHPGSRFAVRSSAVGEDNLGSSFAGQFHSELNVAPEHVFEAFKRVVASKYSVSAMTYRFNRGIQDDEIPMCVGVILMVDAVVGGVAYSVDPLRHGGPVVINAVPGLPKAVVDGSSTVDVFTVSRHLPLAITERTIAAKSTKLVCLPHEGLKEVPLDDAEKNAPCLTDKQVLEVARVALGMDVFYGVPQDIEWAFTEEGTFILLQSRPVLDADSGKHTVLPYDGPEKVLAAEGVCVSPGSASGAVHIVRQDKDMLSFPQDGVLVVEQAHARWAPVLGRASAVIAEFGGTAGHLASVAREYGVPALFGVEHAAERFENGQIVSVDADNLRVIEGVIDHLSCAYKPKTLLVGSSVYKALGKIVPQIVPLNLLYPDSPEFTPENCRTLHDITRYCHEKAVEEMFRLDASIFSERCGKQLKYNGSALQYYIVDINEGFCGPVQGRYIELSQICCKPMLALWDGMLAVPWDMPLFSTGARGFLAVVAESACNPELEITNSSARLTRNYFMVDKDYCNLQASFGYHFCTVECQAGENRQENFVSFHFKGGAANLGRRKMRVMAIAEVLSENGFIVDMKEDTLSVVAEEVSAEEAYRLLQILGFLVIHSRQMDASLENENIKNAFVEALRKGIDTTLEKCNTPAYAEASRQPDLRAGDK